MMKMLSNLSFNSLTAAIFTAVFLVPGLLYAQELTFERGEPPTPEMLMNVRETFEYEVRYGFFTLGWVDVELLPDTTYNGEPVHHMRTKIRSNRRVPFVGTRIVNYESLFSYNNDFFFSHLFWRDDIHDEEYETAIIEFDRETMEVRFFEEGEPADTLELVDPASGGDIVFFHSRMFAGIEERYDLNVYIENEKSSLTAVSRPDIEMRSYDAFDGDVETYRSEGTTDADGPFGFTGRFRSWFLTDDLRVPVEAHVRVIFGNVRVRLISYERSEISNE